jgi:hypothetical protein
MRMAGEGKQEEGHRAGAAIPQLGFRKRSHSRPSFWQQRNENHAHCSLRGDDLTEISSSLKFEYQTVWD